MSALKFGLRPWGNFYGAKAKVAETAEDWRDLSEGVFCCHLGPTPSVPFDPFLGSKKPGETEKKTGGLSPWARACGKGRAQNGITSKDLCFLCVGLSQPSTAQEAVAKLYFDSNQTFRLPRVPVLCKRTRTASELCKVVYGQSLSQKVDVILDAAGHHREKSPYRGLIHQGSTAHSTAPEAPNPKTPMT